MSFYELLILIGVDPKVGPAKAIIWFSSVMIVGVLIMLGALVASVHTSTEIWFLLLIPFYIGAYYSGHAFHIFDTNPDRSGLKDIGHFLVDMALYRVNRDRPAGSIILWQLSGLAIVGIAGHFAMRQWFISGDQMWTLAPFSAVAVFYVVGRLFGHYR